MAQYLKDEVRERIEAAALAVFARKGPRRATVAEIARRARVSTGNLYRYFPDKEALFQAVLPPSFPERLLGLLRRRVASLDGVVEIARLPAGARFHAVSEELLAFSIANRLRVAILLGHADGTRYATFPSTMVSELSRLAIRHYRGLGRQVRPNPELRATLERIYGNWMKAMAEILLASADEERVRERVEMYSRYHLAGLNGLFEDTP